MTASLVAAGVVVNLLAALFTLARVIQRAEQSRYRYELWRIRDGLVDHIIESGQRPSAAMRSFIEETEMSIDAADMLTPYRVFSAYRVLDAGGWRPPVDETVSRAAAHERAVLQKAMITASHARVRLLFRGSPSGWLVFAISPLVALLVRRRHREPVEAKATVETVAMWSRERYGSPVDIMRPLVDDDPHRRHHGGRAAYV